ncbi:FadR/GntR family transcriptional regulator [Nocardioides bizhenqiangii]|uniref:FadR/GntR family transcriptional regulator n=1 Tax=Nocardioides bizhenqiangii TaxID=3095076 RepID=A0ABZ0ZQV3_9ACTN|nr:MULTISPECIES: FadR/GntR family transcriptional regulator [unclassified Nocardioides]MDZ5619331.1 FadR/GntR family transcriptional regulator [Nocardioides sp. HM23]WQQ26647.1 FadR/GntR family transcriptional regulator [Nocardioides sp. HM61]
MVLKPVTRRSVSDQVFDQVLGEVMDGGLAAGEQLPSERQLAEVLGVSRPAVREALQRMAQARLVEVRHGGGATVRDFRKHGGLDLLPHLLVTDGVIDPSVARSVVEVRTSVGPGIAALAAERGGPALATALGDVVDRLAAASDPVTWQELALEFWDVVVDGADSIVFRLMFNGLRVAYEPALPVLAHALAAEVGQVDPYRLLTAAITAGDPATARAAAERVLAPTNDALMEAFAALTDTSDGDES